VEKTKKTESTLTEDKINRIIDLKRRDSAPTKKEKPDITSLLTPDLTCKHEKLNF